FIKTIIIIINIKLNNIGDNDTNNKRNVKIIFFNKSVVSKKTITQLKVKRIVNTYETINIMVVVKLIPNCIYKNMGNIHRKIILFRPTSKKIYTTIDRYNFFIFTGNGLNILCTLLFLKELQNDNAKTNEVKEIINLK
ncbi:hypothetical protein, partial [Staphylococcus agnetis]|uniref:hypothetical protein n=1 Tax=Staphylococcus agnetis TaxID=985762 RepID=UPI001A7E057B